MKALKIRKWISVIGIIITIIGISCENFKAGFNYISAERETAFEKFIFFIGRIGRDFILSTKIGINIDVGSMFNLYYEGNIYMDQLSPSIGVPIFYRI